MEKETSLYLGLDIGSVSLKAVILNDDKKILKERYVRTKGKPFQTAIDTLQELLCNIPAEMLQGAAATGTGGKLVAEATGALFVNEVLAQARATDYLYPQVRTIIEMGGEDSKLIILGYDQAQGRIRVEDFAMNSVCAAGTGSFLDQQASRLNLSIEEFSKITLKSKNPPRIAGRCSVFAKTDMIHLQQIATPDYDIVAGLCFAVARNFKSTIARGKNFIKPVSFQGGVAANLGMRRAFQEVLGLTDEEFIVPEEFAIMGAIGAALMAAEETSLPAFRGVDGIREYLHNKREDKEGLEPLALGESKKYQKGKWNGYDFPKEGKVEAYLGIDVGSISTNVVLIDKENRVIAKSYLMTAGRPLEAVKQGLKEVGEEVSDRVVVNGVGTTGSGRYLTGDFVGADIIRNEITAQATAAIFIDPEVDTIFEIGGQDSKYISIEEGVVVDFEMNKVCAAGTGSFIEEQAERLGISIKKEFGDLALKASCPSAMGERCTVFIESDLVHHQQRGAGVDELAAGLSYSIVHNYLNRVVGDRKIGNRIFFQGGVAANLGVVSAFEKVLGKKIIVPEHHEVTGAIGVAILAKENREESSLPIPVSSLPVGQTWTGWGQTGNFKGFDLSKKNYEITTFVCHDCSNKCDIRKVTIEKDDPLYYGSRCEKYDVDRRKKDNNLPDLFQEREMMLLKAYHGKKLPEDAKRVGIPRILFFYELLPFWKAFFTELGFKVVISDHTGKEIIHDGVERVVAETCFPIKLAHGHITNLLDKKVDYLFIPSFITMKKLNTQMISSQTCPYIQALPYMLHSAFDLGRHGVKVLQPVIHLDEERRGELRDSLMELGSQLKRRALDIKKAWAIAEEAQKRFYESLSKRGREVISGLKDNEKAMVIISRPYNGCDSGLNLGLPQKLKDLGTLAIPIDFLPLEEADLSDHKYMYWKSGQRTLAAAKIIRGDSRLYALFITNFGCGPDSFITHFFKDVMKGKSYLQIEIDEHSADAGSITRCEAFLDSINNARGIRNARLSDRQVKEKQMPRVNTNGYRKTIFLPYMTDHVLALAAAFEAIGIRTEILPEPDKGSLNWGKKYTSGRECYPTVLTTGDLVRFTKSPDFDPKTSAFFMPSGCGPCRFGQYNRFHRLILDDLGYPEVPIYAPNQDENLHRELGNMGNRFLRLAWHGVVATDLLEKKLRGTRPYEKNIGDTEKVYNHYLDQVRKAIMSNGNLVDVLREAKEAFEEINVVAAGSKPVIGIVGEIYIRSNRFSNENIVKKIEALGGEAWLPPIGEWLLYTNFTSKKRSLSRGHYLSYLRLVIADWIQGREEHRLSSVFNGTLKAIEEPTVEEIVEAGSEYLHPSFEGEAILSVGKAVDFAKKGVAGIINVMPFTCMPGTIANAILKRCREDHNNIPYLNMIYEGQEETNTQTRLEAFMHQARQYWTLTAYCDRPSNTQR